MSPVMITAGSDSRRVSVGCTSGLGWVTVAWNVRPHAEPATPTARTRHIREVAAITRLAWLLREQKAILRRGATPCDASRPHPFGRGQDEASWIRLRACAALGRARLVSTIAARSARGYGISGRSTT